MMMMIKMAPRETENNAYAKFWGDKEKEHYGTHVCYGISEVASCPMLPLVTCDKAIP